MDFQQQFDFFLVTRSSYFLLSEAPLAVALCNRFNDQIVVMVGGILCFTGLVIAAISDQFYGVAIGYGIIFGKLAD